MNRIANPPPARDKIRADLQLVADMIEPGTRVLDIGCGEGALLAYLVHFRQVDGRGIELSRDGVNALVAAGLPVIQGDAETDLKTYPDKAFDYVVLSQTVQAMHDVRGVLHELLRIGRRAIVSFPNFGHWRVRAHLALKGRMPVTETLPDAWFDTPNIHHCTIADFLNLCDAMGITIERALAVKADGVAHRFSTASFTTNLLSEQAVMLLSRD